MSDKNRPPQPNAESYIAVASESLRQGAEITFDCWIYLKMNEKMVRWLKAGSIFGPLHAEKLDKLGERQILIPKEQAAAYEAYLAVSVKQGVATGLGSVQTPPVDYASVQSLEPVKVSENVRVFGSPIVRVEDSPVVVVGKVRVEPGAQAAPKPKMKVDVDFINVVIASIQSVFLNICKTPVTFKAPTIRKENSVSPFPINVASFVDLNSKTIRGTVGLCFPAATYLKLLSAATGLSFGALGDDLTLGAAEFMLHIFSTSIPNLNGLGYNIDQAVPFLVTGEDISIRHVFPGHGFSILFDSAAGPFQFEVGIKTGG
jgi:CheY-specific phosphatase CheX